MLNKLITIGYVIALNFVMFTGPALAQMQRVETPNELAQALRSPKPGTVIELASGEYGALSLRKLDAGGQITLRSVDPKNPARFSEMTLREVKNLTLEHVVFDYDFQSSDKLNLRPFQILNSSNITIQDALFEGDLARGRSAADDGFPTAFGLGVRNSTYITLKGNEFRTFFRGFVISQTDHVVIQGNDVHDIRMDGMNFAETKYVLIEANHIHDFARSLNSKDHADMIQFWTNRTKSPSRDIMIRNNVLNSGKGWFTQSIFMRNDLVDRGLAGLEMFYENITIENNLILNAHLHGITVGETKNLKIRNNTVVRNARSEGKRKNPGLWIPQIRVAEAARNVEIMRNVTHRINGPQSQPDWQVQDNFIVQDKARMKPGFYGQVFGQESISDPTRPQVFIPKPGSPLSGMNVGVQNLLK